MDELIAFFRARLDEDEQTARRIQAARHGALLVAPGDGESPTVIEISGDRLQREVEAKRKLLNQYERALRSKAANDAAQADLNADLAHQEQTGVWAGHGFPDVRLRALRREEDYLTAMLPVLEGLVKAEAAVHADHKDYREEWKP